MTNTAKTDLSSTLAISGTDLYKIQNLKMDIIRKDALCKESRKVQKLRKSLNLVSNAHFDISVIHP